MIDTLIANCRSMPPVLSIILSFVGDCVGRDGHGDSHFVLYTDIDKIEQMDEIHTIKPLTITAINKHAFARQVWGEVRLVGDMSGMFAESSFNGDISHWDVSQVENMRDMFLESKFNPISAECGIGQWDVGRVKDMSWMFADSPFNDDISNWDASRVENMERMFADTAFSGDLSRWEVGRVKNMEEAFGNCPVRPPWARN